MGGSSRSRRSRATGFGQRGRSIPVHSEEPAPTRAPLEQVIDTPRSSRHPGAVSSAMAPFVGIALLYAVLMCVPQTSSVAFYIAVGLLIAYCAMSGTVDRPTQTLIAGGLVGLMTVTSFVPPVRSVITAVLDGDFHATESFDPGQAASERQYAPQGLLVRTRVGRDGHYRVNAKVSSIGVAMLVDTGASAVVLAYEDAVRVVGPVENNFTFNIPIQTANGVAYAAAFGIHEVRVGGIAVRDVAGLIAQPGALRESLLGMSFLGRLTRYEVEEGQLVMYQER